MSPAVQTQPPYLIFLSQESEGRRFPYHIRSDGTFTHRRMCRYRREVVVVAVSGYAPCATAQVARVYPRVYVLLLSGFLRVFMYRSLINTSSYDGNSLILKKAKRKENRMGAQACLRNYCRTSPEEQHSHKKSSHKRQERGKGQMKTKENTTGPKRHTPAPPQHPPPLLVLVVEPIVGMTSCRLNLGQP